MKCGWAGLSTCDEISLIIILGGSHKNVWFLSFYLTLNNSLFLSTCIRHLALLTFWPQIDPFGYFWLGLLARRNGFQIRKYLRPIYKKNNGGSETRFK